MTFLSGAWKWVAGVFVVAGAFLLAMARERAIGRQQERAAAERAKAERQRRITDADARGPRTGGDAVDRMRRGDF